MLLALFASALCAAPPGVLGGGWYGRPTTPSGGPIGRRPGLPTEVASPALPDSQTEAAASPSAALAASPAPPIAAAPAAVPVPAAFAPALAPALVLTPEGEPSSERTVHAIGFDGERYYVNGQEADALEPSRTEGGALVHTLAHPNDDALAVTIFHSPASLESDERKREAVERLAPLSAAGAGPRLVEHGEARVPGRGVVHFLVQEAVRGEALARRSPEDRRGAEVSELLQKLERAGLALVVPGPTARYLLERVVLGETASGGRGAYVVGASAKPAEPGVLAAHTSLLKSLLEPKTASEPEAPVAAPIAQPSPRSEAQAKDDATIDSGRLEALALRLNRQVKDDETAEIVAELMAGLEAAPAKATPALLDTVETGVRAYWAILGKREEHEVLYGDTYTGRYKKQTKPLDAADMRRLEDGRAVGLERQSAKLDVYRKLLEVRPDLARPVDAALLREMFSAPLFRDHSLSDQVFLTELARLAPGLAVLATERRDLLSIGDYAAIVLHANGFSAGRYDTMLRSDSRFAPLVPALQVALGQGFEKAALKAPLDELRLASTRFKDGRWQGLPGLQGAVDRVAEARPDFAAALLDPAIPDTAARKQGDGGAGPGENAGRLLFSTHRLPFSVTDDKTFESALAAAEGSFELYKKAFSASRLSGRSSVFDLARFYAEVYALGQVFGTRTAMGPKLSLAMAADDAMVIIARHFPGPQKHLIENVRSVQDEFPGSVNHARKLIQTMLLEAYMGKATAAESGQAIWQSIVDARGHRDGHAARVVASVRSTVDTLLKDFSAGAPSNIAGVLLTGSYAYGYPTPDSDLDLFILTRPDGRDRVKEFIAALKKAGERENWPPFEIDEYNVLPASGERVRELRRQFKSIVFSRNAALAQEIKVTDPYDKVGWLERRRHNKVRARFRYRLLNRLGVETP